MINKYCWFLVMTATLECSHFALVEMECTTSLLYLFYLFPVMTAQPESLQFPLVETHSNTSLTILFISSYDSTTGVFTVPSGGDEVYYFSTVHILFISSYDSTTGVFTVPPGEDGIYYFSTYLLVDDGEWGRFDMMLNDDIICTANSDQDNNGTSDFASGSCSAVASLVAGNVCLAIQYGI